MESRSLSPAIVRADSALAQIDSKVDWLHYLSPLGSDTLWEQFKSSAYTKPLKLSYVDVPSGYKALKQQLREITFDDIDVPLIRSLLQEKCRELDAQIELVLRRDTEGFPSLSVDLFGGNDAALIYLADKLLATLDLGPTAENTADSEAILKAANNELDYYRSIAPELLYRAEVLDDVNSMLMVYQGNLQIAKSTRIPASRVYPLIAHEVGTHIVTRFNGRQQNLKLLEVGLAHYDALQEGLAVAAEFIAGDLPKQRLQIIAARVIASKLALEGDNIPRIFARLHEDYHLRAEDAFDVALRASRGGGLTKDSVYLEGLQKVLLYIREGGDLNFLHLGKFSMEQLSSIKTLVTDGWLVGPKILPRHLQSDEAKTRVKKLQTLSIEQLYWGNH